MVEQVVLENHQGPPVDPRILIWYIVRVPFQVALQRRGTWFGLICLDKSNSMRIQKVEANNIVLGSESVLLKGWNRPSADRKPRHKQKVRFYVPHVKVTAGLGRLRPSQRDCQEW
jgi:hypothetical protein